MAVVLGKFSLGRVASAVEKVQARLLKATGALARSNFLYAVVGGNAVAAWVARVDGSTVRNTRDVDILLRRADLEHARIALEADGFVYRHIAGKELFLDSPGAQAREAMHLIFAGERVREEELLPNPDVSDSEEADNFTILSLQALVQIKLTAFRDKGRMHLRDLIDVGLVDSNMIHRYPAQLSERLQSLLDNPE